jgi:signal transduction histidine kinase
LQRYFLDAAEDSLIAQARITAQALIPNGTIGGPVVNTQSASSNAIQQQQLGNLTLETQNSNPAAVPGSLDYARSATLQLSAEINTRIRILDAQGVVLVDSGQQRPDSARIDDSLTTQALEGDYGCRTATIDDHLTMDVALPVVVDDQVAGVVYLSQPLDDVTSVLWDMRLRWMLSTLIALGLSSMVGLLLSQAFTRPIRRLTTAAGEVAQGNFDQKVEAQSRDELGRLGRAFNDMTARLQAARQMQINFVANVSHELRTPLTSIKGMVETLRDGAVDDPEARDHFLATVESETDRLSRLVNDLLVLSRADAEALNLRREPVDLGELAQTVVGRFVVPIQAKRIAVRIEASGEMAWADADRVAQVLVNLLDNALKYSLPGQTIVVRISKEDQTVLVQVRDEGMGITASDLPFIGQRFYRADKARSRGGSGLGLAIADALVKAHGGRLWIESQEGHGTVANFTLPAA